MRKDGPPVISPRTIQRRTVLEWLGKASVLAIGGDLVTACATTDGLPASGDSTTGAPDHDAGCAANDFAFEPGPEEHRAYESWGERTVDRQDLVEILKGWRLSVQGMVEEPAKLSFSDLLALPRQDQITDFHCVEGWSVYDVPWNGVHFDALFDLVRPLDSATHVVFTSIGDKYRESLPIAVVREPYTLLGYGVDCSTLPLSHGFPLRVVVPRKLGYKNPKYIYRIELSDGPVVGYWEAYGYPHDGDVPPERLRDGRY